jgi:hypothetical protein
VGLFGNKRNKEPVVGIAEGNGSYAFRDVVGESYYRQALKSLVAEGSDEERQQGEVFRTAILVPEPNNPFDKNAIQVRIAEYLVGYIAKERTKEFHPVLADAKKKGFDYVAVKAVIGFDPRNADPLVGVRLDWTDE